MLLRLDVIEEIGRFAMLKHKAEQFGRLSLVFARNGYGKSTVCAVLRSASERQPQYISARRRLNATKESKVQSTWASGSTVAFGSGKWNSCPGKIYVFDQEFLHQNLHVGESVTRDNKRSLLPVVLGEQGVVLAQKILDFDREQRDLDIEMKKHTALIYAKCPVVTAAGVLAFCTNDIPADIAQRIESANRGLQLAKQAIAVEQKMKPKSIELPSIERFREIAARTVGSVSHDVGARVRQHIDSHNLGTHGDRWLKYGFEHLDGHACPFCDQDVAGLGLLAAYEAYFSEAFSKLLTDKDEALADLNAVLADEVISALAQANTVDLAFWGQVCELPHLPTLTTEECASIIAGLVALRTVLEQKITNPLEIVQFGVSSLAIEAAFAAIDAYNAGVTACNIAIDVAKVEATGVDLSKAERIHAQWVAFSTRQSEPIKAAAADYAKGDARRKEIEKDKKAAQGALTTYAEVTMKTRQREINDLLSDFGANFTIANAKANFKGREPNTEYAIAIGDRTILAGDKSDTEPSFKTVLSAGDKTTLALAFFITQVRADPNLSQAMVVFDDPFNSQDMNRQFETTSQVRAIATNACQTFVFSHDPRFLSMIEKDADHAITRTFQLLCSDSGDGAISPWSSADELKTLYVRQAEMIREFASQGTLLKDVTHTSILQAMRPFLEDYIRARFPGRFTGSELIVAMTDAINQAGKDDPMFDSVEDLLALNEYTRINMHGGGQVPDPSALRAQAKKVVQIVGKY